MAASKILALSILTSMVACKQSETSSQSASVADSNGQTEQCGVVQKKGEDFFLKSSSNALRGLEPQDGAVTNILGEYSASQDEVCVRADWSGSSPVMVVSAAAVRKAVKKTIVSEECGIVMTSPNGKLVLQLVGDNSEKNGNRELDPQDAATTNLLKDYAFSMTEVCIKGDFSGVTGAVMVNSQAAVRKSK